MTLGKNDLKKVEQVVKNLIGDNNKILLDIFVTKVEFNEFKREIFGKMATKDEVLELKDM